METCHWQSEFLSSPYALLHLGMSQFVVQVTHYLCPACFADTVDLVWDLLCCEHEIPYRLRRFPLPMCISYDGHRPRHKQPEHAERIATGHTLYPNDHGQYHIHQYGDDSSSAALLPTRIPPYHRSSSAGRVGGRQTHWRRYAVSSQ
jgi:hypothetical protein